MSTKTSYGWNRPLNKSKYIKAPLYDSHAGAVEYALLGVNLLTHFFDVLFLFFRGVNTALERQIWKKGLPNVYASPRSVHALN